MWKDSTSKVNSKEHRQLMSDLASKQMANRLKTNPTSIYSRTRRGTIQIKDKIFFARSSWEANIGAYLQFLKDAQQIKDWEHEPDTFWFEQIKRGVRSYLPDFKIIKNDNTFYYIEVKGYMDNKSKTKLKRMAKYYPHIIIDLIDEKRYNSIRKNKAMFKYWGLLDLK